jgi:hypothetical protein
VSIEHDERSGPCLEALALVGALLMVNVYAFPEAPAFQGWRVNPYLAVVVLASVRYGTATGLWAALASTVAFLISMGHFVGTSEALVMSSAEHYAPVLWTLGAALVCGPVTDRLVARAQRLAADGAELDERFRALSHEYTLLADEKHLLDKQVLSEEETFATLTTLFDELDEIGIEELPACVTRLAARVLGGGAAALYRIPAPILQMHPPNVAISKATDVVTHVPAVLVHGDADWPRTLDAGHPLVSRALRGDGAVALPHVAGWMAVEAVRSEPIHVACAVTGPRRRDRMFVALKRVPLTGFSRARLRALALAMQVVGKTVRRARAVQKLKARAQAGDLVRAQSRQAFRARVRRALAEAHERGGVVHVLTVRMAARDRGATRALAQAVCATLRPLAWRRPVVHAAGGGHLVVLCGTDSTWSAEALMGHLRRHLTDRLAAYGIDPIRSALTVASLQLTSGDMLFRDRQAVRI